MVVCSALLLSNYSATTNAQTINQLDPNQIYNTPNLVNSSTSPTSTTGTWQNVGLWNQGLPCWGPGGPVYCGPQPYFNNGGFNFSYGVTDVYQIANIANALPNTGTGIRVNGFNFGFMAKNGNGWDGTGQDYLAAYVRFYDASGNIARNYDYSKYTNRLYDWSYFSFGDTFTTPYASKDLSTVRYGFVGGDTSNLGGAGWAGPYGPEVFNISFSLKYSVDPCYVDVLSSPSCPGYLDALNKLTPPTAPTNTTVATTTTVAPTTTTLLSPTTSTDVAQPIATTSSTSTVSAPVTTSSTNTTSVTPTATNPQPKVGEVTVSGSPSKTTMSTSQILSIVRAEQSRISNLETSTAQQAVEQTQAASDKAQKDSVSISMSTISQSQSSSQAIATMFATNPSQTTNNNSTAVSNTISGNNNSVASVMPSPNKNNVVDVLKQPEVSTTTQTVTTISKPIEVKNYEPPKVPVVEQPQPTITKPQSIYSLTATITAPQSNYTIAMVAPQISYTLPTKSETNKSQVDEPQKTEGLRFTGTDPILNIINNQPVQQQTTETQTNKSTVNSKVQDNELAGGISLQSINKQPAGFESYTAMIPDASFYAPKEIYRNQKVIDNQRAQRLLNGASDKLHQEMIDQQYNLGK